MSILRSERHIHFFLYRDKTKLLLDRHNTIRSTIEKRRTSFRNNVVQRMSVYLLQATDMTGFGQKFPLKVSTYIVSPPYTCKYVPMMRSQREYRIFTWHVVTKANTIFTCDARFNHKISVIQCHNTRYDWIGRIAISFFLFMRLSCEVGCERIYLRSLLGDNEITFRTSYCS